MSTSASMHAALAALNAHIDDPSQGLPEAVFLFASSITPMVNVDLLVRNTEGHILLVWRDDEFCGKGWHVPGGIIRFHEPLAARIQKTALRELGCRVDFSPVPLDFVELIHTDRKERSHFITFIYDCRLPHTWKITQCAQQAGSVGHLQWHDAFPENMIPVHHFYRNYFHTKDTNHGAY